VKKTWVSGYRNHCAASRPQAQAQGGTHQLTQAHLVAGVEGNLVRGVAEQLLGVLKKAEAMLRGDARDLLILQRTC
jgi:hypothetical protein